MKSIKMKFWLLVLACILLSAVLFIGIAISNTGEVAEKDSVEIMNLMCQKETQEMNSLLMDLEDVVDIIQRYVQEQLYAMDGESTEVPFDTTYMEKAKKLTLNVVEKAKESVAVYLCFEEGLEGVKDGFCLVRKKAGETFAETQPIPLPGDGADKNTEWLKTFLEEGTFGWCLPHESLANGEKVISYINPLYKHGKLIGFIGIDIAMSTVIEHVDSIQVYETGYAFLGDKDKNVYYHKEFPDGAESRQLHGNVRQVVSLLSNAEGKHIYDYKWNGEKKKMTFQTLRNGMLIVLTVPTKEINEARDHVMFQSIVFLIIVSVIFMFLADRVTGKVIKPLKNLTDVAKKVAEGDLDVTIECNTRDEIRVLADSFEQTVRSLKSHMAYINKIAYTDSMTGALNKMAYKEAVLSIEKLMAEGKAEYAVAVMDINNLKKINDNFGHEFGDMLIRDSASIIQRTFKKNEIYRIGGDEFVVILKNEEAKRGTELLAIFNDEINRFNRNNTKYEQKVQIAIGLATYDAEMDKMYRMVFCRADAAMYDNKMKQKENEKKLKEQETAGT